MMAASVMRAKRSHDGVKAEFEMDAKTGIIFDWDLGITAENEDR